MESKRKEIVERAAELFLRRGFKSVSMDEIAQELGISKKTLYKFVPDKKTLVSLVVSLKIENEQQFLADLEKQNLGALQENQAIAEFVFGNMKDTNPIVFYDLQKFFRESWNQIVTYSDSAIFGCLKANLEKGQKEGVYRTNIEPKVMGLFYQGIMDQVFNNRKLEMVGLKPGEMFREMNRYNLLAICSPKGRLEIETLIENNKL